MKSLPYDRVLVVASHPDDEVLGCGATVSRLARQGVAVRFLILGEGITSRQQERNRNEVQEELSRLIADAERAAEVVGAESVEVLDFPDNRFDSVPLLDVVKAIDERKKQFNPDLLITHFENDLNIDHGITYRAALTTARPVPNEGVKTFLSFEVPSSTEYQAGMGQKFTPNFYIEVEEQDVERKVQAMESYRSERRGRPHPRAPESIRALALWRGSNIGAQYAEAFSLIRAIS